MNNIARRILRSLAFVVALAPTTGCTFGAFPRESMAPALRPMPPCFSGDICALAFDNGGSGWSEVIGAARH